MLCFLFLTRTKSDQETQNENVMMGDREVGENVGGVGEEGI